MSDKLARIIRPIVEGQIRGFCKEHPGVLNAVDWYKGKKSDKTTTFVNSISKRIVRDLLCKANVDRIEDAFFEIWEKENPVVEALTATAGDVVGTSADTSSNSLVEVLAAATVDRLEDSAGRSTAALPNPWMMEVGNA